MGKAKKSKNVGSCGMYLFLDDCKGNLSLLVHRRSKQVSESNQVAAPGGIVERSRCGPDGSDIYVGARATALAELREETGFEVEEPDVFDLKTAPECAWWGEGTHFNFGYVCYQRPTIPGPERDSLHELIRGGMERIGIPAGDGYHAWVEINELLERDDLMQACRVPCKHFKELAPTLAEQWHALPPKPSTSLSRGSPEGSLHGRPWVTQALARPCKYAAPSAPRLRPSPERKGAKPKSAVQAPSAHEDEELPARPMKRPRGSVARQLAGLGP
ncbi:REV1 [Symbiodinium natans]|uniref:REV1 protein n=1 Tax=Symbiodinium natans TaxID=878477 RepID=A0A812R1L7_9DINO|nr:REV1 [Symbiodinium natans]